MPKRLAEQDVASHTKKQKTNGVPQSSAETIDSARQLHQLLSFQQDRIPQLRHGIQSFKAFLESILYTSDKSSTAVQQNILADFLQSHTSKHATDSDAPFLPSLMEAWGFAAQAGHDSLLSALPAILALLLKTISTLIEFRLVGLHLCKTILQPPQLKVIAKALSAPKHKEHLISPCLRLLSELVAFDGGTLSNKVFAARAFTFDGKFLARNLSLWKAASEDPGEDKRRPSVRTNAVRFLLAILKALSGSARSELLKYGNVMRALFEHIRHDPVDVLKDILHAVRAHVLTDGSIPRPIKSQVLNDHNLGYIASIYRHEKNDQDSEMQEIQPDKLAHEFLLVICSDSRAGVLRSYAGWYPPGAEKDTAEDEQDDGAAEIDLGLDSIDWYNQYQNSVPVRNVTLARFAQTLRPHSNVLENELLLKILESAPELVADYFFKKSNFSFDPKLTATWIGYSSFLFSTVRLPIPVSFGNKDGHGRIPPPASIVIENIMPQPLTQKILTRCLNQQVELVTFFAARLLSVAFQKLRDVLAQFKDVAATEGLLWDDAANRIVDEFTKRCPKIKDVITAFRKTSSDNLLQKETLLRLISLYYEVTPLAALEEKFDVSTTLAEQLKMSSEKSDIASESLQEGTSTEFDQSRLQLLILNHLLRITHRTPEMKWWQKPESLKLSPFMTLLKIVVKMSQDKIPSDMYLLIDSITKDYGILQQETETPALHALIASLTPYDKYIPSDELDEFIDDALGRVVRKPIKYEDDFDALSAGHEDVGPVSLFMMTLAEQWPFAADRSDTSSSIACWLGRYLFSSIAIGEDEQLLRKIHHGMLPLAKAGRDRELLNKHVPHDLWRDISNLQLDLESKVHASEENEKVDIEADHAPINFESFNAPSEDAKHRGLHRWSDKDIPSAVSDGDLSSLVLCLSSAYPEVRQLALANLRQFAKNLDAVKSSYPEAQQIYLLLGILLNTVTPLIQPSPPQPNGIPHDKSPEPQHPAVPYFCTIYAVLALQILQDPLHPLYPKINAFHTRSPKWDIARLPSYWTHQILFTPPMPSFSTVPTTAKPHSTTPHTTADLAFPQPTPPQTPHHFLLEYIYHSLRTPADLALLRARGTLEPLLALAHNPFLSPDLLRLVLRVVARATCVPGGSTVLVTRVGCVAWLGGLLERVRGKEALAKGKGKGKDAGEGAVQIDSVEGLKGLVRRVWETCDYEYVDGWSAGRMEGVVQGIIAEE